MENVADLKGLKSKVEVSGGKLGGITDPTLHDRGRQIAREVGL